MAGAEVQNTNELLQIRRDKLRELQEAGRDPFKITKYDVTHHSEEIRSGFEALEGKAVSVAGRLMSKRIYIYQSAGAEGSCNSENNSD